MRGPGGHWSQGHEEWEVEQGAARRLVDIDELIDAARWTRWPDELAEELWIDADMLAALVDSLTAQERELVDRAVDGEG